MQLEAQIKTHPIGLEKVQKIHLENPLCVHTILQEIRKNIKQQASNSTVLANKNLKIKTDLNNGAFILACCFVALLSERLNTACSPERQLIAERHHS